MSQKATHIQFPGEDFFRELVDEYARNKIDSIISGASGYVMPEEYGAAGNGLTDDTAAVQAAIDTGRMVLLANRYLVDSLRLKDTRLLGGTLMLQGSIEMVSNAYISDVQIINQTYGSQSSSKPLVYISGKCNTMNRVHLDGSTVPYGASYRGFRGVAVAVLQGSEQTTISECTFHPCFKVDVLANGDDLTVTGCTFEEHTAGIVSPITDYGNAIKISAYDIEHPGIEDDDGGYDKVPNGRRITISECTMFNHGDNPIDCYSGASEVTISGCHITSPGHRCIEIKSKPAKPVDHVTRKYIISNSTMTGTGIIDAHSEVDGEAFSLTDVLISDCVLTNVADPSTGAKTNTLLLAADRISVSDCIVDCGGSGFVGRETADLHVTGCRITNASYVITDDSNGAGFVKRFVGCQISTERVCRVNANGKYYFDGCTIRSEANAFEQVKGTLVLTGCNATFLGYGFIIWSENADIELHGTVISCPSDAPCFTVVNAPGVNVKTHGLTVNGKNLASEKVTFEPGMKRTTTMLDMAATFTGQYINPTHGRASTNSSSACTGYVKVEPGCEVTITGLKLTSPRSICIYMRDDVVPDVNEFQVVAQSTDETAVTFVVPDGYHYVRATTSYAGGVAGTMTGEQYVWRESGADLSKVEEEIGQLKENIAHQLPRPTSGIQVGKYFRVASIDTEGNPVLEAVDLPIADTNTYGMIKARSDWDGFGIMKNAEGQLYVSRIDTNNNAFKNKTNRYNPITSDIIDDTVRIGLLSNGKITDADYPAIHKTLGIEKEWVLKGAIVGDENDRGNIDTGTPVDMTGCTEIIIEGWIVSTTRVLLSMVPPHSGIVNGVGQGGTRYSKTYIIETGNGMSTVYSKASDQKTPYYVTTALTTYDYVNVKPKDITKFLFESNYRDNVTSCDLKIYAR